MMREPQDDGDQRSDRAPAVEGSVVDAPVVAEPESFGTWLRRQREVREIDLREIADSTKVGMSYLRAFEDDRFDVLPAPVFAKGFLRQYARYVGLDPEEVVNFYLAAREPQSDEEQQPVRREPEAASRKALFLVLAATAALVALVWLLSAMSDRGQRATPSPTPDSGTLGQREVPPPEDAVAADGAQRHAPAQEAPASEAVAAPPTPEPRQAEEPAPPLRVTLDFLSDCWVEASVDGTERLSELKVQGESLMLDAEELVELKVGDAAAVQVEVNGVPFALERRPGTSVRNVRIDLETAAAVAGARSPGADG
jgi:cytoskeleton protein RodZ